jgi:hypothetical protein
MFLKVLNLYLKTLKNMDKFVIGRTCKKKAKKKQQKRSRVHYIIPAFI